VFGTFEKFNNANFFAGLAMAALWWSHGVVKNPIKDFTPF
jgi:hypothetical protein